MWQSVRTTSNFECVEVSDRWNISESGAARHAGNSQKLQAKATIRFSMWWVFPRFPSWFIHGIEVGLHSGENLWQLRRKNQSLVADLGSTELHPAGHTTSVFASSRGGSLEVRAGNVRGGNSGGIWNFVAVTGWFWLLQVRAAPPPPTQHHRRPAEKIEDVEITLV